MRFRICQLINKLLNNLDDDAVINDNLADRIFETMLIRLHDKFPAVRVQAVAAISRLQDPGDAECAVISTYLKLMSTDTSAEVRRAVLLNIAISAQTLEAIIGKHFYNVSVVSTVVFLQRKLILFLVSKKHNYRYYHKIKIKLKVHISLFKRAFKMMKKGVYFIVIALLVAELFITRF